MTIEKAIREAYEKKFPGNEPVWWFACYEGIDDAVGFIYYSTYGRDEDEMREELGDEITEALSNHYYSHCI